MPLFEVRRRGADKPIRKPETITAQDAQEAAEKACGEPLTDRGPPGLLRVVVVSRDGVTQAFYARR